MKRGSISIPKSDLGSNIDKASVIKLEMTHLLRELEEAATGTRIKKTGLWRQNPTHWLKKHSSKH